MTVELKFVPEKSESEELRSKLFGIFEDRNKAVAKWFGVEPKNPKINVCASKGMVASKIDPGAQGLGTFAGYSSMFDEIFIVNPVGVAPIFGDNLDKQILIFIDYCFVKYYLKQIYFPEQKDFKLYYKYVSDALAKVVSGNYQAEIVKNNVKYGFGIRPFKRDQELEIVFHIMLEKSGLNYIFEHLPKIMEDLDIKKTTFTIYKKSFNDLVGQFKKEMDDYEKELKLKVGRRR